MFGMPFNDGFQPSPTDMKATCNGLIPYEKSTEISTPHAIDQSLE